MKTLIDLGSNSVKALRFNSRQDLKEPEYESIVCQLVKDKAQGYLHPDAIGRTLEAITTLVEKHRNDDIYLYATESLRSAKNRDLVIEGIHELGLEVDLLSPHEEARIAYLGVSLSMDEPFTVMDIGGGSTELAWKEGFKSFPVGSLTLKEDTILPSFKPTSKPLVAIGGTASNIYAMLQGRAITHRRDFQGQTIGLDELQKLYDLVSKQSEQERQVWSYVDEKRRQIIDKGMAIALHFMRQIQTQEIHLSAHLGLDGYALYKGLIS